MTKTLPRAILTQALQFKHASTTPELAPDNEKSKWNPFHLNQKNKNISENEARHYGVFLGDSEPTVNV